MIERDMSSLSRDIHPVPDIIDKALLKSGLMEAFPSRPPYQQKDYIGWITRAKREETRMKRSNQMLDELENVELYMNMRYAPRRIL